MLWSVRQRLRVHCSWCHCKVCQGIHCRVPAQVSYCFILVSGYRSWDTKIDMSRVCGASLSFLWTVWLCGACVIDKSQIYRFSSICDAIFPTYDEFVVFKIFWRTFQNLMFLNTFSPPVWSGENDRDHDRDFVTMSYNFLNFPRSYFSILDSKTFK